MNLSTLLPGEFEHEMKTTTKFFNAISDDILNFRPHEKSMSGTALVNHLLGIPLLVPHIIENSALDWSTAKFPENPKNAAEMVSTLETNIAIARKAFEQLTDDILEQPWTMKNGETTYFTLPKGVALRNLVLNHIIHHRAQLGVYLRLNNIPVPASYGGSADEAM